MEGKTNMSETQRSSGRIGEAMPLRMAIRGLAISQMLGAACQLGLPDAMGDHDSIGIADLADRLRCHEGALYRLVRTLAAFGVFAIDAGGAVSHTDVSRELRGDAKAPQHLAARFWTLPAVWAAWGKLGEAVRTGQAAFPLANDGRTFFGHLGETPADQHLFRSFMQSGFAGRHEAVAAALALGEAETVVDVGGGSGALLRAVLGQHHDARGILYDRLEVVAGAPAVLDTPGLRGRCNVVGGDFFDAVPTGGTTYLLCWILHDWPDEAAAAILRSVRAAMPAGGRLVIVDRLLDADPGKCDLFDLLEDVNMLVLLGGRERTEAEFNSLMAASGFAPITPVLVQPRFSLLETHPDRPAADGAQG